MTESNITQFWDRLQDTTAGLLGTDDAKARMVPMAHALRDKDSTIWFITSHDTDLAQAAKQGRVASTYVLADSKNGLYATINGDLIQHSDKELRDALWSTAADSWFEGGKEDPSVCIIGLIPSAAEVWITTTSGLSFAYNVLRAEITGDKPDVGTHFQLSQADLAQRA